MTRHDSHRTDPDRHLQAAKILRDPEAWQSVPNLSADEKQALERERTNGFWRQPKELKITVSSIFVARISRYKF